MRWLNCVVVVALAGCLEGCPADAPKPTGTTCADPDPIAGTTQLTWDNFGYDFMCHYCTNCHDSKLPGSQRNGAPLFHDFDSLLTTMEVPDHIDEQAGFGPKAHNTFMPGGGTDGKCPSVAGGPLDMSCIEPTSEERENLAQWLACQQLRTDENASDAAKVTDHCAAWIASH